MKKVHSFSEVLDAADKLTLEEQEEIINILRRRTIELRRKELLQEIQETEHEYKEGKCKRGTAKDLLKDILA